MDLNVFYTWPLNRDYQCNQDLMMAAAKKSGRFKTWLDGDEDQIQAIWQLVDAAGMSHELFTAIECVCDENFLLGWLNWDIAGDDPQSDAQNVVAEIVAASTNLSQTLTWDDPDDGIVDLVPQNIIDDGNSTFAGLASGTNGLAFIAQDMVSTWAAFYPVALDSAVNGFQNFNSWVVAAINLLESWGGACDDAITGLGAGLSISSITNKITTSEHWGNTPDKGFINLVSTFAPKPYWEGKLTTTKTGTTSVAKSKSDQTTTKTPSTNPNNSCGVMFDDSQTDDGNQTTTDGDGQPPLGSSDGDTSLHNGGVPLNPAEISYIALNEGWAQPKGIGLGDVAKLTLGNRVTYAVYGDNHGDMALTDIHTEISVAAHARLKGISVSSVNPDTDSLTGVKFQIWPGSSKLLGNPFTQAQIDNVGAKLAHCGNNTTTQNPKPGTVKTTPDWPSSIDPNQNSGTLSSAQAADLANYLYQKTPNLANSSQATWESIMTHESSNKITADNGSHYGLFQLDYAYYPDGHAGASVGTQTQIAINLAKSQGLYNAWLRWE